jgi:hypothetical protein
VCAVVIAELDNLTVIKKEQLTKIYLSLILERNEWDCEEYLKSGFPKNLGDIVVAPEDTQNCLICFCLFESGNEGKKPIGAFDINCRKMIEGALSGN